MDAPKNLDLAPCGAPNGHWAEAESGVTETVAYARKADGDKLAEVLREIIDHEKTLGEYGSIFTMHAAKCAVKDWESD